MTVASKKLRLLLAFFILCIMPVSAAFAEIKVFEKEIEEIVGKNQSQEQVEAFALQKAKRLAVEEAGTYISSLTIVKKYQLDKDEVTALASGVVQAKIVGVPFVRLKDGIIHVKVKAKIRVDTSILDRQIAEIMKEKGTLKKLEQERRKVQDLENKLAGLKSTELKRLEDLNAQAIALEQEREQQRLIREEQILKAKEELKKAEIDRLQKERSMQDRISRLISEQEKERKKETEALARETDNIRRARLENQKRWNELIRKSLLRQAQWVVIDDTLSLKQAIEETKQIKEEIAGLNQRMDIQFRENKSNLQRAFKKQIALTALHLPPDLAEKDAFETTVEYNKRCAEHAAKTKAVKAETERKIKKFKAEENLRIIQAQVQYLEKKITILTPFMDRLRDIQEKRFILPEGKISVKLGNPDADNSCFSLTLSSNGRKWTKNWFYKDRKKARDFWKTRTYLKSEGLFRLEEEKEKIAFRLTDCRVSHLGTGESRDFRLENPKVFSDISRWERAKRDLPEIKEKEELSAVLYETGGKYKDPLTGMEFILIRGGCFQMGSNSGDSNEKPVHTVCLNHFFIGKYEVTQRQWKAVMGNNPSHFKNCGDNCPVEQVSWKDCQKFIEKLNQREGTDKYRLSTEAEWEYACRAGTSTPLYTGNCISTDQANYNGNYPMQGCSKGRSRGKTVKVGSFSPNSLGLYDMHGNVWEWCRDRYSNYPSAGHITDPEGTSIGQERVMRGGSWSGDARSMRSANRSRNYPDYGGSYSGFRVVRDY